jgi:uncharacterized protein YxeA
MKKILGGCLIVLVIAVIASIIRNRRNKTADGTAQ